jgi:PKD repeat protein
LFCAAVIVLVVAGSAGADQSYSDPQGDAGVGTDIVTVTVRNDSAGNLAFQVASASPIVPNHAIAIFINADRSTATGAPPAGDDYVMFGGPATGVLFGVWNGSQFALATPSSYRVGAATSNITDFRIAKADLGNTSGFYFAVLSASIDPPDPNLHFWDYAPNYGEFSYTLTTPQTPPPPATTTAAPPPPPPPAPPPPPRLNASFDVRTGPRRVGQAIAFTARHPGYQSYEWDFGDGRYGTGRATSHRYSKAGHYTVTLTVENTQGTALSEKVIAVGSLTGDLLPTVFGHSGRSHKDPEYSRAATLFTKTLLENGGQRSVFCWNAGDWTALNGPKSALTEGFVEFRIPRQVNLAPDVCQTLELIRYKHPRPPATLTTAIGLLIFTHETLHTMGIGNEAVATCFALQLAPVMSQRLGAGYGYGYQLGRLLAAWYQPRNLARGYWSSECHDGGKLDLYPKDKGWP